MSDNLGLLVKRNSGVIDKHFLPTSTSTAVKFGDPSVSDSNMNIDPDGYVVEALYDYDPLPVIVGNGSSVSVASPAVAAAGFKVGWGPWDGGADIIDAQGVITPYTTEALYWLAAEKADLQELSGQWNYNSVIDATGSGTHGPLNSLDMNFDVDFGTGSIINGNFEALVGGSTRWFTNFTGTVNGPTAVVNDFSNSTLGTNLDYSLNDIATMSGDMGGVFTGTGSVQGFATGFTLEATIDGGSTFSNLGGVGILGSRTALGID